MALLDRVKERIETDLSDAELQLIIDGITEEIENRFGPNAEITIHIGEHRELEGDRVYLSLARPVDVLPPFTVVEIDRSAETALTVDDFRVRDGGRTLGRLDDGPNPRRFWQRLVRVTYTPISDAKKREDVTIRVVQLEVQYRGLTSEKAGDWQAAYPDVAADREKAILSLAPRPGLTMA